MYMEASLRDIDGETHYVDSTALFISLKAKSDSIVKPEQRGPYNDLQNKSEPEKWNDGPRYSNLIKDLGFD